MHRATLSSLFNVQASPSSVCSPVQVLALGVVSHGGVALEACYCLLFGSRAMTLSTIVSVVSRPSAPCAIRTVTRRCADSSVICADEKVW